MIRPLRRRHRIIFFALAVILSAVYLSGLSQRKQVIVKAAIPAALLEPHYMAGVEYLNKKNIDGIEIGFAKAVRSEDRYIVILKPLKPLTGPDTLIYWTPQAPAETKSENLPHDSYLLGRMAATGERYFELPEQVKQSRGYLLFFSLAHQRVFKSVDLESLT